MHGVQVRTAVQQDPDHIAPRGGHRPVQRCAARAVEASHQPRIAVQEAANLHHIAGGSRPVNGVVGRGWDRNSLAGHALLQEAVPPARVRDRAP